MSMTSRRTGSTESEGALVDLDRYPILTLDAPSASSLVARERWRLVDRGMSIMPCFLRSEAVEQSTSRPTRSREARIRPT